MDTYQIKGLRISLNKQGSREYAKVSYPIRYGIYSEIKTPDHIFLFNLNGEIRFIRGLGEKWPDPSEWLKRTAGNHWLYYSTGGYGGMYDAFGEYYLPCPDYPSNALLIQNPFNDPAVSMAFRAWEALYDTLNAIITRHVPEPLENFLDLVLKNTPKALKEKADRLHGLIGEPVSVLPPDTRHVDYDVIPLTIADGCLYKCGFCRVKSRRDFVPRTKENILNQIIEVKRLYDGDIQNYNSIFLGQHDALLSGPDLILHAAKAAYDMFELEQSHMEGANLFLFGSVDSFLNTDDYLFQNLENIPFRTYINIGLESADRETLAIIKKAITSEMVEKAFVKMLNINQRYERIEITANFLFSDDLPTSHIRAFEELTNKYLGRPYPKGAVYFSPMGQSNTEENRGLIRKFYRVKAVSPLPTYIYLILRL